ncbi:hypothetical protein SSX86_023603 [Deinandra increscens subsp. villosa]|uniref:FBD domain-containing protein n=1 Tax=Deinandra increscens subsp. villosa TaxID=3103831 RepID=A0AAP0CQY9_9ASTR
MKKPKPDEIKQDFITELHDSILIRILSLLPGADANRTRLLSSKWKHRWKDLRLFLPNLHFVMPICSSIEEINKFHDSVDQTLALRNGMPIKTFYLQCSKNCNYKRVYDSICKAVKCEIQELELGFPAEKFIVMFCWHLFKTCSSLVSLTLRGEFVLHVPEDSKLLFPWLKKLNLVSIVYLSDQSFVNLISGCPVLEELCVERQLVGEFDNIKMMVIDSPSLKRLRLSFRLSSDRAFGALIDAPKLEYLDIMDVMSTSYSLTRPLCLTEAHINIRNEGQVGSLARLITCISPSIEILSLTNSTLMALKFPRGLNMPMFLNMAKLMVDITQGWDKLPTLLANMPNLEHITFTNGLLPFPRSQQVHNMRWRPLTRVPTCLRFKLREVIIENREAISPGEFSFIKYLLKHSKKLEILAINAHEIDATRREEILKFYRASKSCRIEFV